MTQYELTVRRIEALHEAELRCYEAGKLIMSFIWRDHRRALESRLLRMTVGLAGAAV